MQIRTSCSNVRMSGGLSQPAAPGRQSRCHWPQAAAACRTHTAMVASCHGTYGGASSACFYYPVGKGRAHCAGLLAPIDVASRDREIGICSTGMPCSQDDGTTIFLVEQIPISRSCGAIAIGARHPPKRPEFMIRGSRGGNQASHGPERALKRALVRFCSPIAHRCKA